MKHYTRCRIEYGEKVIFPKIDKLTPAVGETVDLLPLIDPLKHYRNGTWRKEQSALISPVGRDMSLELPIAPTPAYRLEIAAERLLGDQDLFFGLPVGGSKVRLHLEGYKDAATGVKRSGLTLIDNHELGKRSDFFPNPIFSAGKPVQIVVEVTPNRIWATCDGKTVADWQGDAQRLSLGDLAVRTKTSPKSLFVATYESSYRITKITYTPLVEPKPSAEKPAP